MESIYDFYITPAEYQQAEAHGVRPVVLEIRIRRLGWDKQRAIETPPQKKERLSEWVEIAESNGICYSTLRYRANRLGWDIERAATQPLQDRVRQAYSARESGRKYPKRYIEQAERNGIPYNTFRRRVKTGWTLEKASTQPLMTSHECGLMTKARRELRFGRKRKGHAVSERAQPNT